MRNKIYNDIEQIAPLDTLEETHQKDALEWIASGAPIFRIQKPDVPKKHLIFYCVPIDRKRNSILLVDHVKAEKWLPPGGHVDPDEHPAKTAKRELLEEISLSPPLLREDPYFITVTKTTGITAGHVDVSLWYLFDSEVYSDIQYDKREAHDVQWFHFSSLPWDRCDPHFARFMKKLIKDYPS